MPVSNAGLLIGSGKLRNNWRLALAEREPREIDIDVPLLDLVQF